MSLNRREFISARPPACHISSLVVHSRPELVETVVAAAGELEYVEVPRWEPSGKFVALLECPDESALLSSITNIEALPGVISASLVYHQIDD